jgi:hypothetical protein
MVAMTRRTFGLLLGPRAPNWADAMVFLSLVGLLASRSSSHTRPLLLRVSL